MPQPRSNQGKSIKRQRRVINFNVLPGEPTDGSGRICIHLFVPDNNGPFVEPQVLCQVIDKLQEVRTNQSEKPQIIARPTRGRLACDPKRVPIVVTEVISGSQVVTITSRSDDPRAVTCPACMASDIYKTMMEKLENNKE